MVLSSVDSLRGLLALFTSLKIQPNHTSLRSILTLKLEEDLLHRRSLGDPFGLNYICQLLDAFLRLFQRITLYSKSLSAQIHQWPVVDCLLLGTHLNHLVTQCIDLIKILGIRVLPREASWSENHLCEALENTVIGMANYRATIVMNPALLGCTQQSADTLLARALRSLKLRWLKQSAHNTETHPYFTTHLFNLSLFSCHGEPESLEALEREAALSLPLLDQMLQWALRLNNAFEANTRLFLAAPIVFDTSVVKSCFSPLDLSAGLGASVSYAAAASPLIRARLALGLQAHDCESRTVSPLLFSIASALLLACELQCPSSSNFVDGGSTSTESAIKSQSTSQKMSLARQNLRQICNSVLQSADKLIAPRPTRVDGRIVRFQSHVDALSNLIAVGSNCDLVELWTLLLLLSPHSRPSSVPSRGWSRVSLPTSAFLPFPLPSNSKYDDENIEELKSSFFLAAAIGRFSFLCLRALPYAPALLTKHFFELLCEKGSAPVLLPGIEKASLWSTELPSSLIYVGLRALRTHRDSMTISAFMHPALRTVYKQLLTVSTEQKKWMLPLSTFRLWRMIDYVIGLKKSEETAGLTSTTYTAQLCWLLTRSLESCTPLSADDLMSDVSIFRFISINALVLVISRVLQCAVLGSRLSSLTNFLTDALHFYGPAHVPLSSHLATSCLEHPIMSRSLYFTPFSRAEPTSAFEYLSFVSYEIGVLRTPSHRNNLRSQPNSVRAIKKLRELSCHPTQSYTSFHASLSAHFYRLSSFFGTCSLSLLHDSSSTFSGNHTISKFSEFTAAHLSYLLLQLPEATLHLSAHISISSEYESPFLHFHRLCVSLLEISAGFSGAASKNFEKCITQCLEILLSLRDKLRSLIFASNTHISSLHNHLFTSSDALSSAGATVFWLFMSTNIVASSIVHIISSNFPAPSTSKASAFLDQRDVMNLLLSTVLEILGESTQLVRSLTQVVTISRIAHTEILSNFLPLLSSSEPSAFINELRGLVLHAFEYCSFVPSDLIVLPSQGMKQDLSNHSSCLSSLISLDSHGNWDTSRCFSILTFHWSLCCGMRIDLLTNAEDYFLWFLRYSVDSLLNLAAGLTPLVLVPAQISLSVNTPTVESNNNDSGVHCPRNCDLRPYLSLKVAKFCTLCGSPLQRFSADSTSSFLQKKSETFSHEIFINFWHRATKQLVESRFFLGFPLYYTCVLTWVIDSLTSGSPAALDLTSVFLRRSSLPSISDAISNCSLFRRYLQLFYLLSLAINSSLNVALPASCAELQQLLPFFSAVSAALSRFPLSKFILHTFPELFSAKSMTVPLFSPSLSGNNVPVPVYPPTSPRSFQSSSISEQRALTLSSNEVASVSCSALSTSESSQLRKRTLDPEFEPTAKRSHFEQGATSTTSVLQTAASNVSELASKIPTRSFSALNIDDITEMPDGLQLLLASLIRISLTAISHVRK